MATSPNACRVCAMTAASPGAVSILQIQGPIEALLRELTGRDHWPEGELRFCELASIDDGLVVRLGDDLAQIMPHGGLRIRQRLLQWCVDRGHQLVESLAPSQAYPEAIDEVEAAALALIPATASPLGVDLLLRQSRRWAEATDVDADPARDRRLNRLITPPWVLVMGPPNVGKSSLLNTLAGREVAVAIDHPGTTRDYLAWPVDLGGLVVSWLDTPGNHVTGDPLEQRAIDHARPLLDRADLLISATNPGTPWLDLPRAPDLRLGLQSDLGLRRDADLCVSAATGEGLIELVEVVREQLVPAREIGDPRPWCFPGAPAR